MIFKNSFLFLIVLVFSACNEGVFEMPIAGTGTTVTLSGTVTYDSVPFKSGLYGGLDYDNISQKKVRGVVIEIIDASGTVLATTTTDGNGRYTVTIDRTTEARVRVFAQLYKAVSDGQASWDFKVRDNTNGEALYVMEGHLANLGNSSTQTRNLNASSGWDGSSYSATRVAGPFAILDVVYEAIEKVTKAEDDALFGSLNIFWSINNLPSGGNTDLGQISTSHFDGTSLFILGAADSDTDEYDTAVIAHEWVHYYESKFSRADSIGGAHGLSDMLDIRLAFGEGFATATGGMIIDSPLYLDSLAKNQAQSFGSNLESDEVVNPGWYNGASIFKIVYDVYDSNDDVGDTVSLGFTPIHKVLINKQKNTEAFTSIFTFIKALKDENPSDSAKIDALTSNENIAPIHDIYGTGRTNRRIENANPLYVDLSVGETIFISPNYKAKSTSSFNKLGAFNFIKFTIPTTGTYTITASSRVGTNLDFYADLGLNKNPAIMSSTTGHSISGQATLSAGNYRMVINDSNLVENRTFTITLD